MTAARLAFDRLAPTYDALASGDYQTWHRYTTDQIEDSGQHEVLNWFCLDHVGFEDNPRRRSLGYHIVFRYYADRIRKSGCPDSAGFADAITSPFPRTQAVETFEQGRAAGTERHPP